MIEPLLIVVAALSALSIFLLLLALRRSPTGDVQQLEGRLESLDRGLARAEAALRDELSRSRGEDATRSKDLREEVGASVAKLTDSNANRLDQLRAVVDDRLRLLQEDNRKKLDEIRQTVDERLQGTLETRLGESFKLVSDRLEQVHKGLGEMQALATGVGDLKRVLTNVSTRGMWGEVQLGSLLDEILTRDQYGVDVATKEGSGEHVEFAIKLPGRGVEEDAVWLPIDAKFPMADYERLVDAAQEANPQGVELAGRQLEVGIRSAAKDVRDKYLNPPKTTDFAILYLPTEGLHAEVLRRPGLVDALRRECRVVVAGPTTLAVILNGLQMGFRTLAIGRRSSEVWHLLGAVKTEFERYGEVLGRVQKKLQEASNTIDDAKVRTRAIERKLRDVHEPAAPEAQALFAGLDAGEYDEGPAEGLGQDEEARPLGDR